MIASTGLFPGTSLRAAAPPPFATPWPDDLESADRGAPLLEALTAVPPRPSRLGLPAESVPVARGATALLLLAIALALWGQRLGAPPSWIRLFDNLHWTIADFGAAWLAWIGVRAARARGDREQVLARRWFAFGFSAYAIGQALWDLQVFLAWQPFPAPSDLFYLLLAPCCAAGMMSFMRGRVSRAQRLAAGLDTLSLAIAVVALALVVYLPERGATSPLALGVMVAYPTLLLAGSCVGLMLISLLRVGACWSAWTLIGNLALHGGLSMAWNAATLQGTLVDGAVINACFSVCTLAGGLAASAWRVEATRSARVERFHEGVLRLLPLGVVVFVTLAVVLQESVARLAPSARLLCDGAAVIVVVLAAVRQTLMLRDRDQLLEAQARLREREEELRELNQHLEQRVADRTREVERRNTDLSTALRQLSTAQDELVRAGKLAGLGALVTGVAHEMSTALGNARLMAATLPAHVEAIGQIRSNAHADPGLTDAARGRLNHVGVHLHALADSHGQLTQSIEQAQRVIAGFQQIALDQASDRRRRFDALATVRQIVEITRLSHRHAAVEVVVTGEDDLMLDSFPGAVGQVLGQVIENAFQHAFFGRPDGLIDVRVLGAGDDAVRITVCDDGAGIAALDLPRVFAPFFTTHGVHGGSGLGLTICRNMVGGILGGRIELVSPPHAGTTVTIILPLTAPGAPS